jgi:outer membrane lipoprotein-sorting protein
MSEHRFDPSEDTLQRAIAATRELPLPIGPSAAIEAQTLSALHEAVRQPKSTFYERIYDMPWTSKVSAVLASAASLFIVYVGLSNLTGAGVAFADVVDILKNVHSATWRTTTVTKGAQNEDVTSTGVGMFLAPSHERLETTFLGAKTIQIMDGQKDKVLSLIPATKTAIVIELKNLPPDRENPFGNSFKGLRDLVIDAQSGKTLNAERLGVETIDGRPAEGFRIQTGSHEVTIWADPKTVLPVRFEQRSTTGPEGRTVMTDFQVDVELDESLFSLEIPSDYTLQQTTQLDLAANPINYLAETLQLAAEVNDGVFPAELRGDNGIDGIFRRSALALGQKMAERFAARDGKNSPAVYQKVATELAMKIGGTFGFLSALSAANNDWHYDGKDVKLNTPDRAIFWFKRHKESTSYYVLYADLSVKEVPAEKAPKVPASEASPKQ